MLQDFWGDTSLRGFAPMVIKRFKIIEKLYLSKALLKMTGGEVHPPHSLGSAPATATSTSCTIIYSSKPKYTGSLW